jgi:hypothetical protein
MMKLSTVFFAFVTLLLAACGNDCNTPNGYYGGQASYYGNGNCNVPQTYQGYGYSGQQTGYYNQSQQYQPGYGGGYYGN